MSTGKKIPWMVSLHGGHSSDFCEHGKSPLRAMLDRAVELGFHTYGVAEHAARVEDRHIYPAERERGWDAARVIRDFEAYAQAITILAAEYADRLTVLRGFEVEVAPAGRYVEIMRGFRERFSFDYIVGSVHWVEDQTVDYGIEEFDRSVAHFGGAEAFAIRYYETVAEMVRALRPEVVGHLDVVRKYANPESAVETPEVRRAADRALEAIAETHAILDVNTSALRRGLSTPYPAPWLLRRAVHDYNIPVCFGDDSHAVADVGAGIDRARQYLLANAVKTLTYLKPGCGALIPATVPLE